MNDNAFYMKQQEFVDRLLDEIARGSTLAVPVFLWSTGRLSREERRFFPTLTAMADCAEQLHDELGCCS